MRGFIVRMFYACIHSRRVDEDKIDIGCVSDVHAQVILLGGIGIYAKNTFHFVDRIQLIPNRFAISATRNSGSQLNLSAKIFLPFPSFPTPIFLFPPPPPFRFVALRQLPRGSARRLTPGGSRVKHFKTDN